MSPYRILSLDGGGIRGLYSTILLQRIAQEVPGFLDVDLIAGTSTGGIIALGLAHGISPDDLVALYRDKGPLIFHDTIADDIKDLKKVLGADYDTKPRALLMDLTFGNTKLKDLGRRVLIPTFDLDNENATMRTWKPKFYHNFPGNDSDGEQLVKDVALRTSAAPTYFPTHQGHIDGGVVANNPSMAALAQAIDKSTGAQRIDDIRLFSIGTGTNLAHITGSTHDWGLAQWARPLVTIMIEGTMGVADYQCSRLLGKNYRRISPVLPTHIPIDDVSKIPAIIEAAEAASIVESVEWLKRHWHSP